MKLHFYSDILTNWGTLKGSGILPDARVDEIEAFCAPEQFIPATAFIADKYKDIPDYVIHKPTGKMFHKKALEEVSRHIYETLLSDFLTESEIEILNKNASAAWSAHQEQQRFEKAEKIAAADYDGWVFLEGAGYNEGYFESVEYLKEWIEEGSDNPEYPKYVWACIGRPIVNLDFDNCLPSIYNNAYEGFEADDLSGLEELEAALEKFNEVNKNLKCYYPDYKRVIVL